MAPGSLSGEELYNTAVRYGAQDGARHLLCPYRHPAHGLCRSAGCAGLPAVRFFPAWSVAVCRRRSSADRRLLCCCWCRPAKFFELVPLPFSFPRRDPLPRPCCGLLAALRDGRTCWSAFSISRTGTMPQPQNQACYLQQRSCRCRMMPTSAPSADQAGLSWHHSEGSDPFDRGRSAVSTAGRVSSPPSCSRAGNGGDGVGRLPGNAGGAVSRRVDGAATAQRASAQQSKLGPAPWLTGDALRTVGHGCQQENRGSGRLSLPAFPAELGLPRTPGLRHNR